MATFPSQRRFAVENGQRCPAWQPSRDITNDDLWSAIRGLGMYRKSNEELQALIAEHKDSGMFAGRVIAGAARQVLAAKRMTGAA